MKKKYYHKINDLDIELCETNHKYIMIHQWSKDPNNIHRWGIAGFYYDEEENYWYIKTYGNFNVNQIDLYDFGCLVKLGYKWIREKCFDKEAE